MDWIELANKDQDQNKEVMSYQDYMSHFEKNPTQECRPSYKYLLDMLEHFGKNKDGSYTLFQTEHPDSPPVFGQEACQKSIIDNLGNFFEEGLSNKFLLLVGPNGSSKSSLVRKIMKGAEEYSKSDSGALYSFSWIFPIDNFVKGTLGLNAKKGETDLKTYAYLEDKDVSAIMASELKDHPILLVPKKYRHTLIKETFKDNPGLLSNIKKSYFYKGDLSKRNKMIYDALLKSYRGDHKEVLKHIRIERFNISRRYSTGAVTIEPQLHVDANLQQLTMDKRLGMLPPSLQSLNLFALNGEAILANRGILEFSDLLKRPLDAFKYLLTTMETGNINLQGILNELDIFFIGTSNEVHLEAFKQHPDYKSFSGRFNLIRVPYLLNYLDEMKIYEEQIDGLKQKAKFEPHSLKALCLFAVVSRLRASILTNYPKNERLGKIITEFGPIEKALLYATGDMPDRFDVESMQILKHGMDEVLAEFSGDNVYEGKFGISPRDMKKIIYKLTARNKHITSVEIIEYLEKFITKKNDYDFLNIPVQREFHNFPRIVELIKEYSLTQFDDELRKSLGLVDERSYEEYIKKYIGNVNAHIKGEKVKNEVTGKYEACDTYFIEEFEKNINLKEAADGFRSHLISKLGAYSLDNPDTAIVFTTVFPELVVKLQESFRVEQDKIIKTIGNNIVYYEAELSQQGDDGKPISTPMSKEHRQLIVDVIDNLKNRFHYSENGAISLLKYILKNKY